MANPVAFPPFKTVRLEGHPYRSSTVHTWPAITAKAFVTLDADMTAGWAALNTADAIIDPELEERLRLQGVNAKVDLAAGYSMVAFGPDGSEWEHQPDGFYLQTSPRS